MATDARRRTYKEGAAMLMGNIRGASKAIFGEPDYTGTPNDPGPVGIDAPTQGVVSQNQLKTMAMADDARLSQPVIAPSQPAVPNKPQSQPVAINAPAATTPTFTNNAAFATANNLQPVTGIDGVSGSQQLTGKGGLKIVADPMNVQVVDGGMTGNFVAGPAREPVATQPEVQLLSAQQAQGIDAQNGTPTAADLLSGVRLGSDFGSLKAIQLAHGIATDLHNRNQTAIGNQARDRRLDSVDREIDLREQDLAIDAPYKAALTDQAKANTEKDIFSMTPEGRKAEEAEATAKLQADYDKEDNSLFQKTYGELLKSYEGSGEAITDEQRTKAEQEANAIVARRRDQREYGKLNAEERKTVDEERARQQISSQRTALQTAYAAAQAKNDTGTMAALAVKMEEINALAKKKGY